MTLKELLMILCFFVSLLETISFPICPPFISERVKKKNLINYCSSGGLDCLIFLYKKLLPSLGGYLTYEGEINFSRVDVIFQQIGTVEQIFFKDRMQRQVKMVQLNIIINDFHNF